jgi:putative PIN family toxin of toxin-antitoxin system
MRPRLIVDTNTLISRLLLPDSLPDLAARRAVDQGILLVSDDTLDELTTVLGREKFDRYISLEDRMAFLQKLIRIATKVDILRRLQACRDPKDDKFLELAVNGEVDAIITGDSDLLVLHPFQGIPILTPKAFLESDLIQGS